jgi:hypothetical protein
MFSYLCLGTNDSVGNGSMIAFRAASWQQARSCVP